jgi:hypothetical protein
LARRDQGFQEALELGVGRDPLSVERGVDHAGDQRVDPDVRAGQFQPCRFGQADDAVFGGVVGRHPPVADDTLGGRVVDDGTPAGGQNGWDLISQAVEEAVQVEVEGGVPEGAFHGLDRADGVAAAGVVERAVEPTELLNGRVNQRGDVLLDGDVCRDEQRAASIAANACGQVVPALFVSSGQDHGGAFARESFGGGTAHACSSSGDDDDLVGETL